MTESSDREDPERPEDPRDPQETGEGPWKPIPDDDEDDLPPLPEVEAEPYRPEEDAGPTVDAPGDGDTPKRDEPNWKPAVCHLSPLLGWLTPFTVVGVVLTPIFWVAAPLVVWQLLKEDPDADDQGREAVNFQLNVLGVSMVLFVTCIGWVLLPVLCAVSVGFSLYAAYRAFEGERFRYPFIYRIVQD